MNKNILNESKISGIVKLLVSLFVLLAINTFFQACNGDKVMRCAYSAIAASLILILIAFFGISKIIVSEKKALLLLDIVTIASAVELFLIPKLIGSCGKATMACNTKTMPAITIASLILALLSVMSVVSNVLKAKVGNRK